MRIVTLTQWVQFWGRGLKMPILHLCNHFCDDMVQIVLLNLTAFNMASQFQIRCVHRSLKHSEML